ncbi:MAG: TonB-dependent receptor [Alphaproteobacteria bacterium]|nr:MAG: TonB-dependent receptor [Alphaproteobacteria bacterium]
MMRIERVFSFLRPWPALLAMALAWPTLVWAQDDVDDLIGLSFEDLLSLDVTSVAKKRQDLADAAAAVTVISQEDIRRAGVTTLPELFRMVPGMEVARLDGNTYAVTARGFNSRFADKLLVMIDGRAVYISALSGVQWEQQLVPVEDIARIEIVRGPGATLWGANAVNGVVNIISKHAIDSQGAAASAKLASDGERRVFLRYGAALSPATRFRAYATGEEADALDDAQGRAINDGRRAGQVGFRLDHEPNRVHALTLQGDYQKGSLETTFDFGQLTPPFVTRQTLDARFSGANVLGRWSRSGGSGDQLTVQFFYDHFRRFDLGVRGEQNSIDIDIGYRFRPAARHEVIVGGGYRQTHDHIASVLAFAVFDPPSFHADWFGAFVQDDITLLDERLRLSLGSKFEHNAFTGFQAQPGARLMLKPSAQTTLWAGVSRALRTPSRLEQDTRIAIAVEPPFSPRNPSPLPVRAIIQGNGDMRAEKLMAYELGSRIAFGAAAGLDIAAYYHRYRDLSSRALGPAGLVGTPLPQFAIQQIDTGNDARGRAYGVEAALEARLAPWWRVKAALSQMDLDLRPQADAPALVSLAEAERLSPHRQWSLRSWLDLPRDVELDGWLRRVGRVADGRVPAYWDLDVRVGWRPVERVELALAGDNLAARRRVEFVQSIYPVPLGYVARQFSLRLTAWY